MAHSFKSIITFVPAAALWAGQPVYAQNVTADQERVAKVMQEAGYRAEIIREGDQARVSSAASGYNFEVYFFGCDDEGDNCKTVQFYSAFAPEKKPSLKAMNDYAAKNRWGRIYLDDDGDPCIEMDIDLEDGGMSADLFKDNLEYWEAVLAAYAKFVLDD